MHQKIFKGLLAVLVCSSLSLADDNCQFWNDTVKNLSQAHKVSGQMIHLACNNNGPTCSRVQCSGILTVPSYIPLPEKHVEFCFGLRLDACTDPVSFAYYVDIPKYHVAQTGNFSHNETFDIPGLKYQLRGLEGDLVATIQMTRLNTSFIEFGVEAKVKVMVGKVPYFLDTIPIFPATPIKTPACPAVTPAPEAEFKLTGTCVAPPPVSIVSPSVTPKPVHYQDCELGLMGTDCNENMQCVGNSSRSRNGICLCIPGATMDIKSGKCLVSGQTTETPKATTKGPEKTSAGTTQKPAGTTKSATPSVTQGNTNKKKSPMNKTAIIIGGIAGGILLIVVIVTTIICIGRRRRNAIYRDRQQLLTDEDDDDDDVNMVI